METSAPLLSRKAKGQISFEVVIIIAIVLIFATVFLSDSTAESITTLVAASVKNTAQAEVAELSLISNCSGSYLAKFQITSTGFRLNFSRCAPKLSQIANFVEQQVCAANPNSNNAVECGTKVFYLETMP